MNPIALSAFTNNYIWMFHDGGHAVVLAAILVMHAPGARDALPKRLSSIDRERGFGSFSRRDETSAAQAARSHGAASDEPVAVLAALRQWKNDFR
jgi:hydroxyacylglutathione hydrolase